MEVGFYLNTEEINGLKASFEEKSKFQNLVREMKRYVEFNVDLDNAEVLQALKFDAARENRVVTAEALVLKINENVRIRYIKRHINGEFTKADDFFVGEILTKVSDEEDIIEQMVFRAADDQVVSTLKSEIEDQVSAAAADEERFNEEFNFDKDYYPGQLLEHVNAEGFFDGCIAGGYIFCGGKCGGYPACAGSKSGINKLDNCCKTHDCCYQSRGVSHPNCYCDQRLCDCSQASGWAAGRVIVESTMCFVC